MTQRILTVATLLLCFFSPTHASAGQTAPAASPDRPRVGLVLSGGGARGAAHIGVLKVLEERRVPVDFVAGTSMGAIVGGLYASGMSSAEIETAVTGIDWADVLDDAQNRKDRSFRRKRDDDLLLVKAKPGFDIKTAELKLPAGFIEGQEIGLVLRDLTLPVAKVAHFDDLAIPYRAVATDIGVGQPVVIESGNLADAMRASMSVPGAFSPIVIDGRKLVDGGVTNNLPVDVARGMGADVLIVVDISAPMRTPEQVDSFFAITDQLVNVLTRGNTDKQLATLDAADVLILPDLGDITSLDFYRSEEAVTIGYQAAAMTTDQLSRLAIPEDDYQLWLERRAGYRGQQSTVDFIRIENDSGIDERVLMTQVQHPLGQPLDKQLLDRDIGRIYGLDIFEKVSYAILEEGDKTGVVIDARAKTWGPDFLQFGIQLEDDFDGDALYNLRLAYLRTGMNSLGAEWRTLATVGQEPGIATEWYQPLDRNLRYFVNPQVGYEQASFNVFNDGGKIGEYRINRWEAEMAAGRELSTHGEVRVGLVYGSGEAELRVGDPVALPDDKFNIGAAFAQVAIDRLDNVNFPTAGHFGRLRYTWHQSALGEDSNFDQFEFEFLKAYTWGRHTLVPAVLYNHTTRGQVPIYAVFRAGGFLNLSGLETNELTGETYALARLVYYRRMNDIDFLPVYLGGSVEYGNAKDNLELDDMKTAGSLFLGMDSFIGPLYLGGGLAQGGNASLYMFLGRPF